MTDHEQDSTRRWRRAACVAAITVLAIFLGYDMYRSIVDDEVVSYYWQSPARFLLPIGSALLLGAMVLLVSRLPERARLTIYLGSWAAATLLVACFGFGWLRLAWQAVQMEQTELGRAIARNSQSGHLRYIFGGMGTLLLGGAVASGFLLVRRAFTSKGGQGQTSEEDSRRDRRET